MTINTMRVDEPHRSHLLVIVHDRPHQLVEGSHDELAEGALLRLSAALWLLHVGPDLAAAVSQTVLEMDGLHQP